MTPNTRCFSWSLICSWANSMVESSTRTSVTLVATAIEICGTTQASPECSIPENDCAANPGEVMESWKGPGATWEKENCPSSLLCTSWLGDCSACVSFTRAPATAVPVRSTIVPLMLPGNG